MTDITAALTTGFVLLLLALPPILLRWLKQASVTQREYNETLSALRSEQQGLAREIAACRERLARLE